MTRRLLALTAALALAPLAACGGSGDDTGTPTLDVWIMEGTHPDTGRYLHDLEAAFTDATGARLDIQLVPWTEAQEKFTTAAAGDTLPDVSEIGTTWVPDFADSAILADLTDRATADGLGDDLVPALEQAGTIDGHLYGLPWYAGIRALIYRADIFAEHHLQPPTTWDELLTAAQTISENEPGMIPYPVTGGSEFALYPYIWGAGGEIAVQDGDTWQSAINTPEAVEGITFLTSLATEHDLSVAAADTWDEADALQSFQDGDAAMIIGGGWTVGTLLDADPTSHGTFAATPIPAPDGGIAPSFMGGSLVSVIEGTDQPDLAWQLATLMTTGDFADRWATETGFFPGQQTLLDAYTRSDDPHVAPFATQLDQGARLLPVTEKFADIQAEQIIPRMLLSILSGKQTVQDAADDAADAMNTIFTE